MFLSLYLYHFIRPSGATDSLDIFVAILPLMVAAWVGMTRIIDNKHNASDVVAGAVHTYSFPSLFSVSFTVRRHFQCVPLFCFCGVVPEVSLRFSLFEFREAGCS